MDGTCGAVAGLRWAGPRRRLHRDDDLGPVRKRRGEVDERHIGLPGRSTGARHRIGDARPRREPVQTRAMHGSDHMDDELRAGVSSDRRDRGRRGLGRRARAREMTPREHEHDDQEQRAGDEPPARRGEGVQHVVKPGDDACDPWVLEMDRNCVTETCDG